MGEVVRKDYEKALYWYSKSAEQGDPYAKEKLDELYLKIGS